MDACKLRIMGNPGLELRSRHRCCTMVGLVENALEEIKEKMNPDRIIIESRSAAPFMSTRPWS